MLARTPRRRPRNRLLVSRMWCRVMSATTFAFRDSHGPSIFDRIVATAATRLIWPSFSSPESLEYAAVAACSDQSSTSRGRPTNSSNHTTPTPRPSSRRHGPNLLSKNQAVGNQALDCRMPVCRLHQEMYIFIVKFLTSF